MTGIILAGGRNRRIGVHKALLKLNGETIIENIIKRMLLLFDEVKVITNAKEIFNALAYTNTNKIYRRNRTSIEILPDIIPNKGPLGGIYSGLVYSKTKYNFIVACDMPFINTELVKYMMRNVRNYDIIVPRTSKGYEPLHAIYSKNCIRYIERKIKQDDLKTTCFFSEVKIKEIGEGSIKRFDPLLMSFLNINSDADYQHVIRLVCRL